jgi:sulfur relay (sulfurtransferase) DsrC/TusE family protein
MQDKDTNISQNTDSYLKYVNDWEQKIGSFLEFDIERTKGWKVLLLVFLSG